MRVLFTAQPGHGHVEPLVPAARALLEAGHDVRLGTSASALPLVDERLIPGIPVGVDWLMAQPERAFPDIRGRRGSAGKEYLLREVFCGVTAEATARDLVAMAEHWRPDVIVREVWEFGGALAAAHLDIPSVLHGIGTSRNVEEVLEAGAGRLHEAWRRLGHVGRFPGSATDQLYLDPCPDFLQTPARPVWPAARQALRPITPVPTRDDDGDDDGGDDDGDDDGAVLVTLGTVMHRRPGLLESILRGVVESDRPVIATAGPGVDPAELRRLLPGVTVAEYLPLAGVLPSTAAVVCHGGWSTLLAALGHGLPLVVVPLGSDTAINAARCQEAGLSISVDRGADLTQAVREATCAVLTDPRYRRAAETARDAIAGMPAPEHAVTGLAALTR